MFSWIQKCTSPHKLPKIRVKQITTGAELSFEFPFFMHPRILSILCMHCIVGIDVVPLMDNCGMHINPFLVVPSLNTHIVLRIFYGFPEEYAKYGCPSV